LSGAIGDAALMTQVAANFAELIDAWPKGQASGKNKGRARVA
jgi:myo-inositol catabolism protein IolC